MEPAQTTTSALPRAPVPARARSAFSAREEAFAILPHQRLKQLHQITRSLIASCDPEATIATVIGMLDETVLVRSAVCILCDRIPASMVWSADGVSEQQIQAATELAVSCFAYLLGPSAVPQFLAPERIQEPVHGRSGFTGLPKEHAPLPSMDRRVIHLPLAVEHKGVLGVIQIEGFERFTEVDLAFIGAIASELAVALDRQTTTLVRQSTAAATHSSTVCQQIRLEARGCRSAAETAGARAERLRREMDRSEAETVQERADRTRLAARELQRQYESVLANMDRAFIWEADARTFSLSYLSARVEALLGFSPGRWLEESNFFLQRVHPDDRQLVGAVFSNALSRESSYCEHRMVSADGSVLWFQTSVHLCGRAAVPALQGISLAMPAGKDAAEPVPAHSKAAGPTLQRP